MIWLAYLGAGAVVVASILFLDRVAVRIVRPGPADLARDVPELGVAHDDFVIPSGDHELAAWLLCPESAHPDEPLVLLAHGWGASYSTVLELGEPLARAGHDVLLFDVRGHGRNEPLSYVTVRHFRDDAIAAIEYARRRFPGRRVVLVGHSMGGAAAVLAAAEGAPVDGIVAIAAPADILTVTAEYLTERGLPGRFMTTALRPFWWRRIGGSFRPLTPSRRIGDVRVPVLMIQPENDMRVNRGHADRLKQAAGIDYHLIEGREHTDVLGAPETLRLIEGFLRQIPAAARDEETSAHAGRD